MTATNVHSTININSGFGLTRHAWERMSGRGFSPETVRKVLSFGRIAHIRGATIYAVGRKEIARYTTRGVDLGGLDGVQVVCSDNGTVITVYRNRDLRGLRPRRSRHGRRAQR
jgi:hypothetical protein